MSRLLVLMACWIAMGSSALAGDRPNIIMIFTDDQRADAVGYSGNTAVLTPHLDRLAEAGLVFDNCLVNTSICAISRANILAGQYPGRHGIDNFHKTFNDQQLQDSVPGRLQRAGYQTAFFGKWGIGDSPEKTHAGAAVFDYWAGQPMQTCFFHQPNCKYVTFNGFDRPLDDLCDCPADSRGLVGYRNRIGMANLLNPLHVDSQVTPLQVGRFLDGRDEEKPFCMMLFFKAPHSPFQDWDPAFEHITDGLSMPVPPGATKELAQREPAIIRNSLGAPTGNRYLNNPAELDGHMRDYYRLVTSMDAGVGRVMAELKARGLDDNTVVLFTSDNGHFFAEHGMAEKWLMYEPSLQVPGFIYDPRQPENKRGQISRKMVITTDFSVTMLALAGVDAPTDMTGRDLSALIENPTATDWRDEAYYDHPYGHGGKIPRTIGVRGERFVYTRYIDVEPAFEQLFDLHADPNQLNNLADNTDYADQLSAMRRSCDQMQSAVGP